MKPYLSIIAIAALLSSPVAAQQQQFQDDTEGRAHFSMETKLNRKWTAHLDQQYRFGDNISRLIRGSAGLGLTYKVTKNVKLLGEYSFLLKGKRAGYYTTRHWFSGAVMLRHDINRWRFVYRNRVQFRRGDMNTEDMFLTKIYDRNKLSIRYEATKRFTYYTSAEIYIPLNNPQFMGIDRTRHHLGLLYRTFRNQQLELYLMYQQQLHKGGWWDMSDRYPEPYKRVFALGIGYGIEI